MQSKGMLLQNYASELLYVPCLKVGFAYRMSFVVKDMCAASLTMLLSLKAS